MHASTNGTVQSGGVVIIYVDRFGRLGRGAGEDPRHQGRAGEVGVGPRAVLQGAGGGNRWLRPGRIVLRQRGHVLKTACLRRVLRFWTRVGVGGLEFSLATEAWFGWQWKVLSGSRKLFAKKMLAT